MLVLSRYVGQQIVIGEDITVTIMEVRGDKVKIGIIAPSDVEVDRLEIREQKQKEVKHDD